MSKDDIKKDKYIISTLIIFLVLFSLSMIFSPCPFSQRNLKIITIQEDKVNEVQKEMEILTQFLISNSEQILWIRGFLLTIMTAIIGYSLKEFNSQEEKNRKLSIYKNRYRILVVLFLIIVISFIIEFFIEYRQACLINRIYQLDCAVNDKMIQYIQHPPCSLTNSPILQEVFRSKVQIDLINVNFCGIWNTLKAYSFWTFYVCLCILPLIFLYFLRNLDPRDKK